jgi:hypothetical protein
MFIYAKMFRHLISKQSMLSDFSSLLSLMFNEHLITPHQKVDGLTWYILSPCTLVKTYLLNFIHQSINIYENKLNILIMINRDALIIWLKENNVGAGE